MQRSMPVRDHNVLTGLGELTQSSYRAVVASIINAIKAETGDSDQDIADKLGCSKGTINNASNKVGDLSPVTMLKLGKKYGLHRLQPIAALIGARLNPQEAPHGAECDLPIGAARFQLFLCRALADQVIDDAEILAGAAEIEAGHEAACNLKTRLDEVRARREGQ